jgi:hypothetical protein
MAALCPAHPRKRTRWPETGCRGAHAGGRGDTAGGQSDRLRAHQVAQIAASIVEVGWTNPVLITGSGQIIAGHGRVPAAQHLGLSQVPVLVLDHLTPGQRLAYVFADNKVALNSGWDDDGASGGNSQETARRILQGMHDIA